MNEERPDTCVTCGAPVVWCMCRKQDSKEEVRFSFYERDGYMECWYCSHGWACINHEKEPPEWQYCPNCGHKIGEVVRVKIEEENE